MTKSLNPRRPVPRGCAVAAGFFLMAAGLAGLTVLWNTMISGMLAAGSWEAVPCMVLKAETVANGNDPQGHLQLEVRTELAWEYRGVPHRGGQLDADAGFHAAESANAKEELCHNLRQNPRQICFVNPDDPAKAILRKPGWGMVLMLCGLAAMLIVVGITVMHSARRAPDAAGSTAPGCLPVGFALLAGLALAGGGVAIWWHAIRGAPDWSAIGARMQEVPCTVAGSSVREERSGRQNYVKYRPQVIYRYEWDGRSWFSEWMDFERSSAASNDPGNAAAIVEHYRRGSTHTCWVDPQQPWVSVLKKSGAGFPWPWISAVLCLMAGGALLAALIRKALRTVKAGPRGRNPADPPPLPE